MKTLITFFVIISNIIPALAQENYPKPTAKDVIFYIQHNRGKNTFTYQPNFLQKDLLNEKNPIIVRRQLFDKNGEIEPLSTVQKRYAYGVKSRKIKKNTFEISLVSYEDQKMILKMNDNEQPYVETTVNGQYMILERLFLQQKEGTSGLKTKVDFIIFIGKDKNGKEVQSKLIP